MTDIGGDDFSGANLDFATDSLEDRRRFASFVESSITKQSKGAALDRFFPGSNWRLVASTESDETPAVCSAVGASPSSMHSILVSDSGESKIAAGIMISWSIHFICPCPVSDDLKSSESNLVVEGRVIGQQWARRCKERA